MILTFSSLDKAGRDIVSGLVIGYEADALHGVPRESQFDRLIKWRSQGWDRMVYHYNILAVLIGYQQASRKMVQSCMTGFERY